MHRILLALHLLLVPLYATAATLRVCPSGCPYATPSQAAAAVQDGDTVEIEAGTYPSGAAVWAKHNLTLRGVNGQAHITGATVEGKALWLIKGTNTTVESIAFTGARVSDGNGAGIKLEGDHLTVRHCLFADNENGLLTGNQAAARTSDVVIEFSEFARNGGGDGLTHNVYVGSIRSLTFRGNYSHGARVGHLLKSRAAINLVEYNRLTDDPGGTASYELDFPSGGAVTVRGNIVRQDALTENGSILAYGAEGAGVGITAHTLLIESNTVIGERAQNFFLRLRLTPSTQTIRDNVFTGVGDTLLPASGTAIRTLPGNGYLSAGHYVDATRQRYRLAATAPALDIASQGPPMQYLHPMQLQPRTAVGAGPDMGAYERGIEPTAPTRLLVPVLAGRGVQPGTATLQWGPVDSETHTVTYQVLRDGAQVAETTQPRYQEAIPAGVTLRYQVRAMDDAGQSTVSDAITFAVPRLVAGPPIPQEPGWYELANTTLRQADPCPRRNCAYSGVSGQRDVTMTSPPNSGWFDAKRNTALFFGGGHAGYHGNEIYAVDLTTHGVRRLTDPGEPLQLCTVFTANNTQPSSRHTVGGLAMIAHADRLFVYGGCYSCPSCNWTQDTWTFDLTTNAWQYMQPGGPLPKPGPYIVSSYDPVTKNVLVSDRFCLYAYNVDTNRFRQLTNKDCGPYASPYAQSYHRTGIVDPVLRKFYVFGIADQWVFDLREGSQYLPEQFVTTNGEPLMNTAHPGLTYDTRRQRVTGWNTVLGTQSNTVYALDAATRRWTRYTFPGGPPGHTAAQAGGGAVGTQARWSYSPQDDVFFVVNSVDDNAFAFRMPREGTQPQGATALTIRGH